MEKTMMEAQMESLDAEINSFIRHRDERVNRLNSPIVKYKWERSKKQLQKQLQTTWADVKRAVSEERDPEEATGKAVHEMNKLEKAYNGILWSFLTHRPQFKESAVPAG